MNEILRVEHLKKYFVKKSMLGTVTSTVRAADDVSFSLGRGEVFVLAGESGSGKSTIAKMILGSVRPDSGRIIFEGAESGRGQKDIMRRIRMSCQMVHQDPYDSINPRMRVSDIITEPLEIHGTYNTKRERAARVKEVLGEVRLEPAGEIAAKYPHVLSGGQRQRVVLARALALRPKVIIADEPVSMLDVSIRAEMLELMRELQAKHGISFIYITHDLATARHFGQRVGILYRGRIVEMGEIDKVLFSPQHPYTQALTDAISEPDPDNVRRKKTIRIVGDGRGISLLQDGTRGSSFPSPGRLNAETRGGCRFAPRCPYVMDACSIEPDLVEKSPGHQAACHADIAADAAAAANQGGADPRRQQQ